MTTLLLVRHGETDWNAQRRWQGHSDPPLSERGREQARTLADRLAGTRIDAVYASDLRRAAETAAILAGNLGVLVELDPDLREVNAGSWEGLTADEILALDPAGHARFARTGEPAWRDGESYVEMAERVYRAVGRIARRHPGQDVLVVSHGGPVKALQLLALGRDFPAQRRSLPPIENCQICRFGFEEGVLRPLD